MTIREFIQAKSNGCYTEITEMPHEEGGFGRLYRAIDRNHHDSEVCIKVIKANLSKDLQIKLWHGEVNALKQYRNRSGIVHLVGDQYHFDRDDPYHFIVMEYVHGKRLGSSKYRIELDVQEDQALRLIFQLCSVIYSIHQRGNYHQDIFPDNIKIQDEKLILLDLGGMREAERRSGTIIFGGEMYSPPEVSPTRLRMKRFRTLRRDHMGSFESADIFSLGAILYELLMGTPFYDSIEQSNQLKEYIYDYYSDRAVSKASSNASEEYEPAIALAHKHQQNFYTFLTHYQMPPELCDQLKLTLSLYPHERPSIDTLLKHLLPYLFHRAMTLYRQKYWQEAIVWIQFPLEHFEEIQDEIADITSTTPDPETEDADSLAEKMMQHLLAHLPVYIELCLLHGMCLFQQGHFQAAQQTFLKTKDLLTRYEYGCDDRQWNTYLLKTANNLAACYHKRHQNTEAMHLYKSLSTAQGIFGQIISRNVTVCTTDG
ncbi:protein kinase [candidate division KSB3 bacterium]|uniref:Protein kinase n=1 Tax=candidate division KSB3 bacterium TaxID=2044937 RepID=A0A9D5Q4H5_9BACT|nr:protein kinase [candidate division KSB3 bacterium]MBD3323729.1 protein kinase [candidate division KSB3 bacterium]